MSDKVGLLTILYIHYAPNMGNRAKTRKHGNCTQRESNIAGYEEKRTIDRYHARDIRLRLEMRNYV